MCSFIKSRVSIGNPAGDRREESEDEEEEETPCSPVIPLLTSVARKVVSSFTMKFI